MKFVISQPQLVEGVSWALKAIDPRPVLPILGSLQITAKKDIVEIFGFNHEVLSKANLVAEVKQDGNVLVSAKLLYSIVSALPKKEVTVEQEENKLHIHCGSSKFTLPLTAKEDYPELPEHPESIGEIDAQELGKAISQVSVAAAKEDATPILTGIKFEIKDDEIKIYAIDRYRLATKTLKWKPKAKNVDKEIIIKSKTINETMRTLETKNIVEISANTDDIISKVSFDSSNLSVTSQLLSGDFPPVQNLFEDEYLESAIVEKQQIIEAINRVTLINTTNPQITLTISKDKLLIAAGNNNDAFASEEILTTSTVSNFKITFNSTHLKEGILQLEEDFVLFRITNETKPVEINGIKTLTDKPSSSFKYLIVPIFVNV